VFFQHRTRDSARVQHHWSTLRAMGGDARGMCPCPCPCPCRARRRGDSKDKERHRCHRIREP